MICTVICFSKTTRYATMMHFVRKATVLSVKLKDFFFLKIIVLRICFSTLRNCGLTFSNSLENAVSNKMVYNWR
jgi:hypothetical protein